MMDPMYISPHLCRSCSQTNVLLTDCHVSVSDAARRSVFDRCRSNDLPNTAEKAQVNALVQEAQCDLTRFDDEILRVQAVLARLLDERYELQRFVDSARSLAAPIRKLPPEVLSEIFDDHCLWDRSLSITGTAEWVSGGDKLPIHCPPLDIARTCAFWRSVVFSRPTLWASLEIDLAKVETSAVTRLTSYYLQASRSSPLEIAASVIPDIDDSPCELSNHALDVFDLLLDHSHRWKEMSVFGNAFSPFLMRRAISRLSTKAPSTKNLFPILENLCWSWPCSEFDDEPPYHELFSSCSTLQHSDIAVIHNLASIHLPNLTELRLDSYFEGLRLATLLALLPNLRKCSIEGLLPSTRPLPSPEPNEQTSFNLSQLSLEIFSSWSQYEDIFFQTLSLPHLKTLKLKDEEQAHHSGFFDMLDRSKCCLDTLDIVSFSEKTTVQILERLTSLSSLVLWKQDARELSSSLLKRLTLSGDGDGSSDLVPNLESLHVYVDGDPDDPCPMVKIDAFCAMVESRFNILDSTVPRLKRLTVQAGGYEDNPANNPITHPLLTRLQPLVDAGLVFKLIDPAYR